MTLEDIRKAFEQITGGLPKPEVSLDGMPEGYYYRVGKQLVAGAAVVKLFVEECRKMGMTDDTIYEGIEVYLEGEWHKLRLMKKAQL